MNKVFKRKAPFINKVVLSESPQDDFPYIDLWRPTTAAEKILTQFDLKTFLYRSWCKCYMLYLKERETELRAALAPTLSAMIRESGRIAIVCPDTYVDPLAHFFEQLGPYEIEYVEDKDENSYSNTRGEGRPEHDSGVYDREQSIAG